MADICNGALCPPVNLASGVCGDIIGGKRFRREARAAARLHHTNIAPVYGVGEENGLHYYAMQYIQGLGLDEVLAELRRLRQLERRLATNRSVRS